jgi:hypothetical protein
MARSRMVLKSNFRKLIREMDGGMEDLRDRWLDSGLGTTQERLTRAEQSRGYNLQELYESISAEKRGDLNAAIVVSAWYAHFFEYGTRFHRPAALPAPGQASR